MTVKRLLTALATSVLALTAHAQLSVSGGAAASGISGYDGTPAYYTGPADAELMGLSSFNGLISAGFGGSLEITYLGSEAAHNNMFKVGDFSLTTGSNPTPFSQSYYVDVGPGNLNFSFITPLVQGRFNRYDYFTKPVLETLESLGVRAELGGRNDILVGGLGDEKGMARLEEEKELVHGPLLSAGSGGARRRPRSSRSRRRSSRRS